MLSRCRSVEVNSCQDMIFWEIENEREPTASHIAQIELSDAVYCSFPRSSASKLALRLSNAREQILDLPHCDS